MDSPFSDSTREEAHVDGCKELSVTSHDIGDGDFDDRFMVGFSGREYCLRRFGLVAGRGSNQPYQ